MKPSMTAEQYLNHPTFGLLYGVCPIDEHRQLFTTLYAQRLFFIVNQRPTGMAFESISRTDARMLIEQRLRSLRRLGKTAEYQALQAIHRQAFM
ncbi:PipX family protein [Thermosynechococcus sp. QKsg1]|nr:DUF3539 family protein [Thermosynechococcus sp. CL-1]WJI23267.1 PipX family protein [Thermosynechococcus sp. B0]WJI25784.1 PipX family protein [Thermosynechococcus sp. B1]WKT82873.1 PipX family protein [Thermosynechococcus sp. HY596]WNC62000.1 PipX family protein [Thermosynechococcus sp. HY591]WNC64553.1 PipX family protein [Thermosynechococcus sp. HY593]WNC85885.1 PipX family protein [Thermosynechococcus sp. QKsg1]